MTSNPEICIFHLCKYIFSDKGREEVLKEKILL